MTMQSEVQKFHEKNGLPVGQLSRIMSPPYEKSLKEVAQDVADIAQDILPFAEVEYGFDQRLHRMHLILEEAAELAKAFLSTDRIKVADALGDLLYVVLGTGVVYNIPLDRVFAEIQKSNMTKDCRRMATDRRAKGPDYVPPDLSFIR